VCAPTVSKRSTNVPKRPSGPELNAPSDAATSWLTKSLLRQTTESPGTICTYPGANNLPGMATDATSARAVAGAASATAAITRAALT
jgi:hypothetical protein